MTWRRDGRRAAWCVLAALLLTGCGGGDDPAPAPAGTAQPSVFEVDVSAPENGARVKGDREVGGRISARVVVQGTANPGVNLMVEASCESDVDCRNPVRAEEDGSFETRVDVWSQPGGAQGRLVVGGLGSAPADRRRIVVLLVAERKRKNVDESERPKRKQERRRRSREREREREVVTPPPELEPELEAPLPPEVPAEPLPIPTPSGNAPRTLVMIGDSLAQGTEPYLAGELGGWEVSTSARRGRPLAEGMSILGRTQIPSGPVALAFSLFTNDNPNAVAALESAVRTSVARAGARGCAVWATIARPPLGGVSYQAANQKLRALAAGLGGRMLVVPWAETVAANPGLLGRDRIHATSTGYRTRAQLYAQAAKACPG